MSGTAPALRGGALFLLALLAFGAACSDSGDDDNEQMMMPAANAASICVAGEQASCPCPSGQGVHVCLPGGTAFGMCMCPTSAGSGAQPSVAGSGGMIGAAGMSGTPAMTVAGSGDVVAPMAGTGMVPQAGTGEEPMSGEPPLAGGIKIAELALFQAVKVSLARDGEAVIERNAPVIIGKEALLRVFVEPGTGFTARDIDVELTLSSAEADAMPQLVTQRVSGPSSDSELDSTINFRIPGDQITADLRYSVALREHGGGASMGTVDPNARFPKEAEALLELGPRDAGPLRIMIVPYRYQGDGSARLPAIEQEQIDLYQAVMHAFYPASEIQFEMHDPVDYNAQIGPQTGWEQWLDAHCQLRNSEDHDPKQLYYGIMAMRQSMQAYGGGIIGISNLPGAAANYGRCSVGIGFEGALAATTMAHEIGHSLGLPHAPCGVSGGPYPYEEAKIGVWGYSLSSDTLKDPDEYYDMMSYCDPAFISDYNFERLFERIRYLNLQFDVLETTPQRYVRLLVSRDGSVELRGTSDIRRTPGGPEEERAVTLLNASGARMSASGPAYFFPFSEEGAGLWLVPDMGASAIEAPGLGRVTLR